jgi:hypothetical protein
MTTCKELAIVWKIRSSNLGGKRFVIPEIKMYCPGNNIQDAPGHPAHIDDVHSTAKCMLIDHTSIVQRIEEPDITSFKTYFSVIKPTNTFRWVVTPVYSLPPTRFSPSWAFSMYHNEKLHKCNVECIVKLIMHLKM